MINSKKDELAVRVIALIRRALLAYLEDHVDASETSLAEDACVERYFISKFCKSFDEDGLLNFSFGFFEIVNILKFLNSSKILREDIKFEFQKLAIHFLKDIFSLVEENENSWMGKDDVALERFEFSSGDEDFFPMGNYRWESDSFDFERVFTFFMAGSHNGVAIELLEKILGESSEKAIIYLKSKNLIEERKGRFYLKVTSCELPLSLLASFMGHFLLKFFANHHFHKKRATSGIELANLNQKGLEALFKISTTYGQKIKKIHSNPRYRGENPVGSLFFMSLLTNQTRNSSPK